MRICRVPRRYRIFAGTIEMILGDNNITSFLLWAPVCQCVCFRCFGGQEPPRDLRATLLHQQSAYFWRVDWNIRKAQVCMGGSVSSGTWALLKVFFFNCFILLIFPRVFEAFQPVPMCRTQLSPMLRLQRWTYCRW